MKLIEITALDNGAHNNQTSDNQIQIPNGWAVIPDDMEIPNTFPFVNITVDGQTVTSMTDGVVPEPKPAPVPEPTLEEQIASLQVQLSNTQDVIDALLFE